MLKDVNLWIKLEQLKNTSTRDKAENFEEYIELYKEIFSYFEADINYFNPKENDGRFKVEITENSKKL